MAPVILRIIIISFGVDRVVILFFMKNTRLGYNIKV